MRCAYLAREDRVGGEEHLAGGLGDLEEVPAVRQTRRAAAVLRAAVQVDVVLGLGGGQ